MEKKIDHYLRIVKTSAMRACTGICTDTAALVMAVIKKTHKKYTLTLTDLLPYKRICFCGIRFVVDRRRRRGLATALHDFRIEFCLSKFVSRCGVCSTLISVIDQIEVAYVEDGWSPC